MAIDLNAVLAAPADSQPERGVVRLQHFINRVTEEFVQLNGRSVLGNLLYAENLYYYRVTDEYQRWLAEFSPQAIDPGAWPAITDDGIDPVVQMPLVDDQGAFVLGPDGQPVMHDHTIVRREKIIITPDFIRAAKHMSVLVSDETEELNEAMMAAREKLGNPRSLEVTYEIDSEVLPLRLNVNQLTVSNWKVTKIAPVKQLAITGNAKDWFSQAGADNARGRRQGIERRRQTGSTGNLGVVGTKQLGGGSNMRHQPGQGIGGHIRAGLTEQVNPDLPTP